MRFHLEPTKLMDALYDTDMAFDKSMTVVQQG